MKRVLGAVNLFIFKALANAWGLFSFSEHPFYSFYSDNIRSLYLTEFIVDFEVDF